MTECKHSLVSNLQVSAAEVARPGEPVRGVTYHQTVHDFGAPVRGMACHRLAPQSG